MASMFGNKGARSPQEESRPLAALAAREASGRRQRQRSMDGIRNPAALAAKEAEKDGTRKVVWQSARLSSQGKMDWTIS